MLGYQIVSPKIIKDYKKQLQNVREEQQILANFIRSIQFEELQELSINQLPKNSILTEALDVMLRKMLKVSELENQRRWTIEGFAKFSEILRANNNDLQQLSNDLLSGLVSYMQAVQGAVFILRQENKNDILDMIACYAYSRKKFLRKTLKIDSTFSEDLVVQAYLEKKHIYLPKVPKDYIKITSGLGESNPNSVFILPLCFQDKVLGVIELASFYEYEPYQIEFLEKLAESIASTISAVKNNQQTQKLLQETQEQTERLRAQEEEIRQNNEELMATQEEMRRRSNELDGQLAAISNSSILKAEFSPQGMVENVNQAFCDLFGYEASEIIGKSHQLLLDQETRESADYQNFWQGLRAGNPTARDVKRINNKGEAVWLNATYTPVFDLENKVYKIIKLAFDITEARNHYEEIRRQNEVSKTNELVMRKAYEKLSAVREELNQKIVEIEEIKQSEAQRFKEKDEKSQAWVSKAMEKFKKIESELKAQLIVKDQEIEQLKHQLSS
jgi:PAS domain S-box-containing protein